MQEAHPVRLKKVLVIHAASFINQIMMILRPLIKSDLLQLLQFTANGPLELFSEDVLPEVQQQTRQTILDQKKFLTNFHFKDYGGSLKPLADYAQVERNLLESKYRDWLIDTENLKEIRPKKCKDTKRAQSITANFSKLEID